MENDLLEVGIGMNSITILKGNVMFAPELGGLNCVENGYIVAEHGRIIDVFAELPGKYAVAEIEDFGDALITPAFVDMHLHAPQYSMVGLGMNLQLLDWLNTYTFKTESLYGDAGFAREAYGQLAAELISKGTTRVCMFSSLHRDSTLILMEELEKAGVTGYVGKVNMDRNSPAELSESTEQSKAETLRWLEECGRFKHIKPIITPRFTPSCTNELMEWLGKTAGVRDLRVQSHLSENLAEMAWVRELHPDCERYWQTYNKYGLWKHNTVMAHCVHCDAQERAAIKRAGVVVAHCPDSNLNLISGIAPVRTMLREGIRVALGSDMAGGAMLSMTQTATMAIRVSKLRWYADHTEDFLTVAEAFYLITTAGQQFFEAGPGFKPGDMLHAVVLSDKKLPKTRTLTNTERLERIVYLAQERDITAVYSEGRRVK